MVNFIDPTAPSGDLQHLFVLYVDHFSELPVRLLGLLINPEKFGMPKEDASVVHGINPRQSDAT